MTVDYKDIVKAWDSQKPSGRSNGKSFWFAVRVAIEKQIPKKPLYNGANWYRCPNGCEVHKKQFEKDWYCPMCGQAILWEGVKNMTDNERKLIGIIETLCDAVSDSPCGCDACPYVDTMKDDQCEVYDIIGMVERGVEHG